MVGNSELKVSMVRDTASSTATEVHTKASLQSQRPCHTRSQGGQPIRSECALTVDMPGARGLASAAAASRATALAQERATRQRVARQRRQERVDSLLHALQVGESAIRGKWVGVKSKFYLSEKEGDSDGYEQDVGNSGDFDMRRLR